MIKKICKIYGMTDDRVQSNIHMSIYECIIAMGCILAAIIMIARVFYGTEITDEAYYVSDAIAMIHGNIPYAYNNYSYGTGTVFLMIPFIYIYGLIVPNNEGVFLFTRICYMLLWYTVLIFGYRILKKDFKRSSAMLVTGFLIPYAGSGAMFNFGYDMVPCALSYIGGLTIYDAIEHKNNHSALKLFIAGFIMGIAFFAQPGYAVAIAIFATILLLRSAGAKGKIYNLLCYAAGGFMEILVVAVPIMIQTSPAKLVAGIQYKLNPYPTGVMYSGTFINRLAAVMDLHKRYVPIMAAVFIFLLLFSFRYVREKERKLSTEEYVLFAVSGAIFFLTVLYCRKQILENTTNINWQWGFIGSIGIAVLLLTAEFKKYPVILYMGIYPVIFVLAEIVAVDSSASIERYVAAVPSMAIYILVMLNRDSEITRIIITVSTVVCILSMGINDYRYIYRDEHFSQLNYKVESGVYKGLYTTKERAHDLPELEEYLNSIIDENEYYAFRDNVPAGYLMVHNGIMCDKATWDCLNYSYAKNAPAPLYEYYQRRGAFPEKYIYVDYGRDANLSIEDSNFKFNEFVNSYYEKIADFNLNTTFYHIIVYKYKGGFDGDFDYWIERHMYTEE